MGIPGSGNGPLVLPRDLKHTDRYQVISEALDIALGYIQRSNNRWRDGDLEKVREAIALTAAIGAGGQAVAPTHGYFSRAATKMRNDPEGVWVRRADYEAALSNPPAQPGWRDAKGLPDNVQKLVKLMAEVIPALEATGVNVSLAANVRAAVYGLGA